MKSENTYIGDEKFTKFLEHYSCPTPLDIVKMRFAGSICSPNTALRPTDIISSLWPNNQSPRLETKKEAELFFKFFMGLWDEMFNCVTANSVSLPHISSSSDLQIECQKRHAILEFGFIEGFWGGLTDIKIPAYIAEVLDSLSQLAETYHTLSTKIDPQKENKNIFKAIIECDKMVDKSLHFIIANYVLPHMEELKHTIN